MNPHRPHPTSIYALFASLFRNRSLVLQLARREVAGRYRGSIFGLVWSLFNPLLMLAVYTLVFSGVFKTRWGVSGSDQKTAFAAILF